MAPTQLFLIRPDPDEPGRVVRKFLLAKEAAGLSPASLDFYRYSLGRFVAFCPGWPPTPGDCRAYLLDLARARLSLATRRSYYGALAVFLNWCLGQGWLAANPLDQVDKPKAAELIPRAIPKETLARLFGRMERAAERGDLLALRDLALFRLLYDGGLRAGEAAALRVVDLDLGENAATVVGKGQRGRVVYYGRLTCQALRRLVASLHPGCPWMFVSVQVVGGWRPLTRNGIRQALRRWCKRAGMEPFRVHDLRHSYARHALRAGIDIAMVSRQLGHHDPAFTVRVYGQSEDPDRRRAHLELSPGDHLE